VRPITVNLATRPFRDNRPIAGVLGTAAVLIALLAAYNAWTFVSHGGHYAAVQERVREDRARLEVLEGEERALAKEIAARDFRAVYERGRFASELILRRAFSWTLLFNTLEAVIPPDVMMSAIRPTISGHGIQIRVEGLAKSSDALYGFQGRLMGNPTFADIRPISERRLNPARPDITFVMSFEYRPQRRGPPPAVTAAAAPAPPPPATTADRVAAPATAGGTVGRDGRPSAAAAGRLVAAPGGVRVPAGVAVGAGAATAERPASGGGRGPSSGAAGAAPRSGAPAPASAAGPAGGGSDGAGPGGAADGSAATEGAPGAARAAARVPPLRPAKTDNQARLLPPSRQTPEEPAAAAPAVRLDLPLRFADRPVREVYEALSRAHGVRFDIDAAVDRDARVSADLGGRPLPEAIASLARAAGHRIVRVGEGRYRVALTAGGERLGDAPVREETLPPLEGEP
jgi:hypothetical protein